MPPASCSPETPGGPSVQIVRLGHQDVEELLGASELFDHPAERASALAYLDDERNVFFVARASGRTVGFLRGTALGQLHTPRRQMFLYEIEVIGGYRGRGVGARLVRTLLQYCRVRGFEEAFVFTDPGNLPAVALYRSTGGVTETPADRMFVYRLAAKQPPPRAKPAVPRVN